ncbi:MAG: zinc ribbon domain-containing protein [Chloroflexota bacterium]|nr:zinc ribbon domain-containing protein [Chloroflexota bacterium]
MPIYDYKCAECDTVSELLVRAVDSSVIACPECGSSDMEKLLSASYMIQMGAPAPGTTCCGLEERCATPACSEGGTCCRE